MRQRAATWRWWGVAFALCLTACDGRSPGASDPYDAAKMDLKPKPARVTSEVAPGVKC